MAALPLALRLPALHRLSTDPQVLRDAYAADEERARAAKRRRVAVDEVDDAAPGVTQTGWAPLRHLQTPHPARPVYTASDYVISGKTLEEAKRILRAFPALATRNFYVVQNHHATAKHHDLRIHLDGATISFAVPKGLSTLARGEQVCQAFETDPHPVNYSIFEGNALGTTAVWDIGTYTIHRTKAEQAQRDEESDDEADEEGRNRSGWPEDVREEDLFCEKYHRAAFLDEPARLGRPSRKAAADTGHTRAFIIELNGKRYRGLRLRFFRTSSERKPNYAFAAPSEGHRRWWMIENDQPGKKKGVEDLSIGDRSVLSHLDMDGIKRLGVQYGQ